MFEDSLFASRVGTVSADRRWTWAASLALQATIATVVIVVPMFHPEVLQIRREVPKVLMPLMPESLRCGWRPDGWSLLIRVRRCLL